MSRPFESKTVREFLSKINGIRLETIPPEILNSVVLGVTSDSRQVQPGVIFVAFPGEVQDGHKFIAEVECKGALCILGERDLEHPTKVPYLKVFNGREALAQLAADYYGNPSGSLLMIGVTGTSGKTTTTYVLESILQAAGHRVGVIGTINFRFGSKVFPSSHTTPGPVELQKLLFDMKVAGCSAVVMEISSHALKQHRADFIAFDGMIFTNLSSEHLDFHKDMEDYFRSKSRLFIELAEFSARAGKSPVAAINSEDEYGRRLIHQISTSEKQSLRVYPYSTEKHFVVTLNGLQGQINGVSFESSLTGRFNGSNISSAVTLAQNLGIPDDSILKGITQLDGVPGRLEKVGNPAGIHIWVDYAHKPDALEKVLKTLREIRGHHRLITVFGCGGDRDRTKRPVMGRIAADLSEHVFITSDNPRTENPMTIIQEILKGIQGYSNFTVEIDRRTAISKAIRSAKPGDLILVAGKGHEDYQIIGTEKIHFDDREVILEVFQQT
jgi:UDP-N-acetylmuramoyl-L-alanyl-D-glutamate--2,6-diaminopimelate ligase